MPGPRLARVLSVLLGPGVAVAADAATFFLAGLKGGLRELRSGR